MGESRIFTKQNLFIHSFNQQILLEYLVYGRYPAKLQRKKTIIFALKVDIN